MQLLGGEAGESPLCDASDWVRVNRLWNKSMSSRCVCCDMEIKETTPWLLQKILIPWLRNPKILKELVPDGGSQADL